MPTYEYRCGSCTHQFEVFARMSDPDPEVCEACGEHTLTKVLFPVAVHYKGSGFYNTDYAAKQPATTAETGASGTGSAVGDTGSSGGDGTPKGGESGSSSTPAKSSESGSSGGSSGSSNDG